MIKIMGDVNKWKCIYKPCGAKCCTEGRPITPYDIREIRGLGYEDFYRFDEKDRTFRLRGKDDNKACVFLKPDFSCEIRENAPLICRLVPFEIDKVSYADEPFIYLKPMPICPGYDKGDRLDKEFRNSIEECAMKFIREGQVLQRKLKDEKFDAESWVITENDG